MAWLYTAAGVVLLPWIVYLAVTLPRRQYDRHYRAAWVGFDLILVFAISRTAYMAFRFDPRVQFPATATAVLLFVDAWFDVTTSSVNERILSLAHLDRARAPTRRHWWARRGSGGSTVVVEEVPNGPLDQEPGLSG